MADSVVWHGTPDECRELLAILGQEDRCTCVVSKETNTRLSTCAGHRMAEEDQRALDGLLVYRHISGRLLAEEWNA